MARYSIGGRATVVGTSARAVVSIFNTAAGSFSIREIGVSNTTAVAVTVGVIRFSAATNVGTGLTEVQYDPTSFPPLCTVFAGHTADGTTAGGTIVQASLGAAVGSGWVWTFGDCGLRATVGTANGVGVYIPTGTGQLLDVYVVWDE
jgi:hypothetical protein